MNDELRFERIIDAPPEMVFTLFTAPEGQEAFYGRDDPDWIVESRCELRVGGVWAVTFGPRPDQLTRHRHTFVTIDRPRRLVLDTTEFRFDSTKAHFTTEFTFAAHDDQTLMTMIQTGLPTTEARDEHSRGLSHAFNQLERILSVQHATGSGYRPSLSVAEGKVQQNSDGTTHKQGNLPGSSGSAQAPSLQG